MVAFLPMVEKHYILPGFEPLLQNGKNIFFVAHIQNQGTLLRALIFLFQYRAAWIFSNFQTAVKLFIRRQCAICPVSSGLPRGSGVRHPSAAARKKTNSQELVFFQLLECEGYHFCKADCFSWLRHFHI